MQKVKHNGTFLDRILRAIKRGAHQAAQAGGQDTKEFIHVGWLAHATAETSETRGNKKSAAHSAYGSYVAKMIQGTKIAAQ